MTRDCLVQLLDAYWFAPPVALWRAIELRAVGELEYERPLLDLGCGDGLIGQIAFGTGPQVEVGLDPWLEQLRQAAAVGIYRHIDQGIGHALPYADGSFSTVFSNSVLEHIPEVAPVLHEVSRVLRPGGRFVFTVPSDAFPEMLDGYALRMAAGDPRRAAAYVSATDERLEHHHYHTPQEWAALLSDAGMALQRANYYMPSDVERFWDRVDRRWAGSGHPRRLRGWVWRALVSPRLRPLGHQQVLRRLVVAYLRRRWRPYYDTEVDPGAKGGGLLVVAQRKE